MTVGFFRSFCCGWTGFLGDGATVDLQTEGWDVMSQGGDGLVVVLVGDAEMKSNIDLTGKTTGRVGNQEVGGRRRHFMGEDYAQ